MCRSCHGYGLCLSCGDMKVEKRSIHAKVEYDEIQRTTKRPLSTGKIVDGFEDINLILNQKYHRK